MPITDEAGNALTTENGQWILTEQVITTILLPASTL
jgi:hypothetical protein